MEAKHELDMTTGNLLKKMIFYTIPIVLTGVLQLLFNAVDVIVVGKFAGKEALAAVGSTTSLINLIINLFVGISIGSSVVYARSIGMKDYKRASDTVHTSVLISLVTGFILTFIGIFGAKTFLTWMKSPSDVIDLATTYVQIYFAGVIFVLIFNFTSAVVRAHGDTKRPLYALAASGVINVILNLIFVICFKMSVAGVALATIISEAFCAIAMIVILVREKGPLHLDFRKLRFHKSVTFEMIRIGLPSGIQGTFFSISNTIIQTSVNSFNSAAIVAGNSAASSLEGLVWMSMNAFYQATMNFTSQNYGANKFHNTRKVLIYGLICVFVVGEVLGLSFYLLGPWLLRLYSDEADVINYGVIRLGYLCALYGLCGIMDVMVGGIRGIGSSITPMVVSLLGACVFRIGWIATIFKHHKTLEVLYISYPISWVITFLVHVVCYFIISSNVKKRLEKVTLQAEL